MAMADRRRQVGAAQHATPLPHRPGGEFLEDGKRFRAPGHHQQAAMLHRDAGGFRHLGPDIAGATRAAPGDARLLARDGHKTEIAHRGADGTGFPINDCGAQAQPRRGQRMREADDAAANDQHVERSRPHAPTM